MLHTGCEVQTSKGWHHDHETSMEEGEEDERVLPNLEEGEGEELEQLSGPAEEEVTAVESVL